VVIVRGGLPCAAWLAWKNRDGRSKKTLSVSLRLAGFKVVRLRAIKVRDRN
jgi:hypothetical protein